ncbi:lipid droplet-associated hydrolase-like isoform X1 [Zingiber officinale]|uniref:lipid droplet-associated hydrolase-like isoform X1 n=2 Tax=Zingiber officinale TaxID=94328 RepID=UPI001C4DD0D7|nr:lipid droplet-associated hydrolase-like isoform X1 [Zingiber officinale]
MTLVFSAPVRFTGLLASRLLRLLPTPSRPSRYLRGYIASLHSASMGKQATLLMRTVSGYSTESLEIHSEESLLHIIVIPGNPGIASYYKDFVEAVYQLLEGQASITAIGHVSHSAKDWEHGRKFSLEEQIAHKVDFIKQEFQNNEVPIILVGHSIGSYICLEVFKRLPQQVKYVIGLYPFLTLNKNSFKQSIIGLIARSSVISAAISYFASLLRSLPISVQDNMVRQFLGKTWSATAVAVTCSHLLQYHTMRNMLFLAMTEFEKLSEEPDWMFMKRKHNQLSFLFGIDDHWAPLSHFEEVSRQVPGLALAVEREGHMHAFCCTQAGSSWVGHHVASLIRNQIAK